MKVRQPSENDETLTGEELRARLQETEELLRALRHGDVDALVVSGADGDRVYTLKGAEHPYRVMIEAMNEGAVVLTAEGTISYSNGSVAALLNTPLQELIGASMSSFVVGEDLPLYRRLFDRGRRGSSKDEVRLTRKAGSVVPVLLSISAFDSSEPGSVCAVITDLTEHKRNEALMAAQALEHRVRVAAEASRQRIANILGSITDAFLAMDRESRITDANQRAAALLGRTRDELVGNVFWDLFPQERETEFGAECRKAMADGVPVHFEGLSRVAEGSWFETHVYPADEGLTIYFRDITARKRTEARTAYQANLLANIHDAVIATDDRFILTAWNTQAEEMYGWKAEEVLGRNLRDVIRADLTRAQWSDALKTLAETGHYRVEVAHYRRNGTRLWIQGHTTALRDETGRIIGYVLANRDITERRCAEALLQQANQRTTLILDSITDRFFALDNEWRLTYLNKQAEEQVKALGKDPASLIGKVAWEEFRAPAVEEACRRAEATQTVTTHEFYYPPLGEWVENRIYPSPDGGVSVFQRYVTDRKRAEEELRRSEAYLLQAQKLSHTGSWVWKPSSRELIWSLEHFRICGVDPDSFKLTRESAQQLIHPEDLPAANQAFERAIRERTEFDRYFRIVRPDGTVRYVHSVGRPAFDRAGDLIEYVGTIIDITPQKAAEQERARLLGRVLSAHEEERRRVSREIHDELGQQLSVLSLKLGALKQDCGDQATLCAQIESIEAVLRQLDSDVDFLVWNLRPTALDDLGLVVAFSNVVSHWAKHLGIHAELHTVGMDDHRLASDVEVVLYRVLQEALNNVAKHAAAQNVTIFLERLDDDVSLIIEDDGRGFEAGRVLGGGEGLGLIGMRERAALVGGTFELESSPGRGTTVVVQIPLTGAAAAEARDA